MTTFALREPWRPSPGRSPPEPLHQSEHSGALSDDHAGQSPRAVSVIEIQANQPWRSFSARRLMDDGSTNGSSRSRLAGAVPRREPPNGRVPYKSRSSVSLTSIAANAMSGGQFGRNKNDNRADQWASRRRRLTRLNCPVVYYEEQSVMWDDTSCAEPV